jgi:hypothetical protein
MNTTIETVRSLRALGYSARLLKRWSGHSYARIEGRVPVRPYDDPA